MGDTQTEGGSVGAGETYVGCAEQLRCSPPPLACPYALPILRGGASCRISCSYRAGCARWVASA